MTLWGTIPSPVWVPWCILALVAAQRLLELVNSRRNTARLLAQGAREIAPEHYPLLIGFHMLWLIALGAWVLVYPPRINVVFLAIYAVLQAGRLWTMLSLGPYWTTRIITLPDAPLVRRGPYRFLRHPNYVIVVLEIATLPLALAAWPLAVGFSVVHAFILRIRIRAENAALADRRPIYQH